MKHSWLVVAFALGACSSGTTHTAVLGDATGLVEGAPVMVAGVRVGEIEAVTVQGTSAHITFRVESDHEVALKSDACVTRQGTELNLFVGQESAAFDGHNLPSCVAAAADALFDLGRRLSDTIQGAAEGVDAHEVGRRVGEGLQELGDGFGEGVGDFREAGRKMGRAARELEEGAAEGAEEPSGN